MLNAEPLNSDSFAPFGQVISLNQSGVYRNDHAAELFNGISQALPRLSSARRLAATLPISLTTLENHPFLSQTFIPTDLSRYVLAVCEKGESGKPDLLKIRAFVGTVSQGVSYSPGVWHGPMTVIDRDGEYMALRWLANDSRDNELFSLPKPVQIFVSGL